MRRDLRLQDNHGLYQALSQKKNVQCLFIFDKIILDKVKDKSDARVTFINDTLMEIKKELQAAGSDLWIKYGTPAHVFQKLTDEFQVESVFANHDYEPYARKRDAEVGKFLAAKEIPFLTFKDQCLFEKSEILTDQKKPYTVFTPYKRKVLSQLTDRVLQEFPSEKLSREGENLNKSVKHKTSFEFSDLGFSRSQISIPPKTVLKNTLQKYTEQRNFPAIENGTSRLGVHLRFGTVSVRQLAKTAKKLNDTWLSELIWRDFFMQILWHFPKVATQSFRPKFDEVKWRDSAADFKKWCEGNTGYPLVDAGMRELNATGHMHNRVRMVVASFLTKHLLIYWFKGERYFSEKLLDYDLSANNGNWQWAAGTGCDAAPYFRIFNPMTQAEKFDPEDEYILKWVPEYGTDRYVQPMVEHNFARGRALATFAETLKGDKK